MFTHGISQSMKTKSPRVDLPPTANPPEPSLGAPHPGWESLRGLLAGCVPGQAQELLLPFSPTVRRYLRVFTNHETQPLRAASAGHVNPRVCAAFGVYLGFPTGRPPGTTEGLQTVTAWGPGCSQPTLCSSENAPLTAGGSPAQPPARESTPTWRPSRFSWLSSASRVTATTQPCRSPSVHV